MRAGQGRRPNIGRRTSGGLVLALVVALTAGLTPRWASARTTSDGRCAGQRPTVVGTAGDDTIVGTARSDVIVALGGSDRISGGGGYDVICGGDGNDTVHGAAGTDVIYGEAGNDVLEGGADSNVVYGGAGYDRISGGDVNDILYGEAGTDVLYGEGGNDQLHGGGDSDAVFGGAGNDFSRGETGNDVLYGEAGNDRLDGEAGDDQLYGGEGHDQVHGRQGRDVLLGDTGNDLLDGGADADECNAGLGNDTVLNCETGPYTAPGVGQACAGTVTERLRLVGADRGYPSPYGHRIGPGLTQANYLFDTLVWKDATGEFIPWLAEEYQSNPDRTEWRFQLRDGLRWQDGRPLTADDVVFTHQYMLRHEASLRAIGLITLQGLEAVREVVAESPRVVIFRLHRPYSPFLDWIGGRLLITPRHVWENVQDPVSYRDAAALMGSGPYSCRPTAQRAPGAASRTSTTGSWPTTPTSSASPECGSWTMCGLPTRCRRSSRDRSTRPAWVRTSPTPPWHHSSRTRPGSGASPHRGRTPLACTSTCPRVSPSTTSASVTPWPTPSIEGTCSARCTPGEESWAAMG